MSYRREEAWIACQVSETSVFQYRERSKNRLLTLEAESLTVKELQKLVLRCSPCFTALDEKFVFAIGGFKSSKVARVDLESGIWLTGLPELIEDRVGAGAVTTASGIIYVVAGLNQSFHKNLNSIEKFQDARNPSEGKWSTI